jgi:hypothetical protein
VTSDRVAAAPHDEAEREEVEGESEEDSFDKTFASGTILTHFFANDDLERRRSVVADFNFVPLDSVPRGETQQEVVRSVDDSPSGVPVSVTLFAGRGVAAVYVGGCKQLEATTALSSLVGVGAGGPVASESGMALLRVSQAN